MNTIYDKATDSLYIELSPEPAADSNEVAEGVILDYDVEGRVVGIDLQFASQRLEAFVREAIGAGGPLEQKRTV